eukprot:6082662-Amphidinium_carterae.1
MGGSGTCAASSVYVVEREERVIQQACGASRAFVVEHGTDAIQGGWAQKLVDVRLNAGDISSGMPERPKTRGAKIRGCGCDVPQL